jgi:hypothetical protein
MSYSIVFNPADSSSTVHSAESSGGYRSSQASTDVRVLTDLESLEFKLRTPIWVEIQLDENHGRFLATGAGILGPLDGLYGAGETAQQAVSDFESMLVDLFIELNESQNLSATLQIQLAHLNHLVQSR